MLQDMFDRQRKLASNFIPIEDLFNNAVGVEERQRYLATYWQLLAEEGVEMLRELPARKFWRASVKTKEMNVEAWKEEMMDILHIVIALCLIGGMDAQEVYERYVKKNEINFDRVKNNS